MSGLSKGNDACSTVYVVRINKGNLYNTAHAWIVFRFFIRLADKFHLALFSVCVLTVGEEGTEEGDVGM